MTARDRMVVMVLAIAAVMAGGWFAVVGPRRAEVAAQRQQITQARQARDAAVLQAAAGRTAQHNYQADRAAFAELGKAVPESDEVASLLYQLQDAAGRSHVALTGVTPTAPVTTAPAPPAAVPASPGAASTAAPATPAAAPAVAPTSAVVAVPISLSFEGSYRDLESFLRRIHRLTVVRGDKVSVRGRLVSVQAVQLSRQDPGVGPVRATVAATTYTAAVPTPVASGAAASTGLSGADSATGPAPIPAMVTGGAQ